MRITTTTAKVTYVLGWVIVGLMLNVLLGALGLWGLPQNLITSAYTAVTLVAAVRAFRGRDEPAKPRRAWWRATGGWVSSLEVGTLFAVLGAACWWATATGALPGTTPFTNPLVTASCLVAAAYYLHSGWRLARQGDLTIEAARYDVRAPDRHP
jgi:hypothetical protein